MSADELTQMLPMQSIRRANNGYRWEPVRIGDANRNVIRNNRPELNKALRKFGFTTPQRLAAFFGNATQETKWFAALYEKNHDATYYPWDGRGFLQLTIPSGNTRDANNNYFKYWRFRGRNPERQAVAILNQWRDDVADDRYDAANSATAYWVWPGKGGSDANAVGNAHEYADMGSAFVRVVVATDHGSRAFYTHEGFRRAAAAVNRPASVHSGADFNGMSERNCAYVNARMVLDDVLSFPVANGNSDTPQDFEPRRP